MASSVNLGYPAYCDGMQWTSLLQRSFVGGVAVWDSNASAAAVNPLGGVVHGPSKPLAVSQLGTPGMGVLVNAGYAAVPHLTQGHGVYIFGLLSQGTLTVASNSSGQTRIDLVLACVYDLGNGSSYCDVEIYEGTPGAGQPATPGTSVLLATVSVASGATSITTSSITDKRTFTVAAGGVLPASTAAAPPVTPGQIVYNTSTGTLQRAASATTYSQTWAEPGTYSWFMPANALPPRFEAWAAGGGGGGYDGSDNDSASGAGGAEYAEEPGVEGLVEGNEIVIVVGAGGAASGISAALQTAGGDTTFALGASTLVHAHGGSAGVNTSGQSVPGGTGSANTIHFNGGAGGPGQSGKTGAGGGGGGSGGPGSAGMAGQEGDNPFGGQGAEAVPGGGPGGDGGGYFGDGQAPPTGPGGGGGGSSGASNTSGPGDPGQATITWTVQPATLTALASAGTEISGVDTSTGTAGSSGLTAGSGSGYGWGIGYGSATYSGGGGGGGFFGFGGGGGSSGDADGQAVPQIQVQFEADGSTDFQLDAKWGMVVPEAAADSSSPSIATGRCRIIVMIDSAVIDSVWLMCGASGGVTTPGDAGSFTVYTSSAQGTTPAAGTHTATLAIETSRTLSGQLSGAHIGNLASTGTSSDAFGSVPSYFTTALTAENCYLRVAGILASAL